MAYASGGHSRRRRSSQGSVLASALIVAAIAAMLYGGFTIARDHETAPMALYVQPPAATSQPRQPSVRDTVRDRLAPAAPKPVSWPMRMKSRFVKPGVLQAWGSTAAPDGATVTVHVRPVSGRWSKLGDAPVARGHFLLRQTLAKGLRGERIQVRARFES